jgi:hypothetical protein
LLKYQSVFIQLDEGDIEFNRVIVRA